MPKNTQLLKQKPETGLFYYYKEEIKNGQFVTAFST